LAVINRAASVTAESWHSIMRRREQKGIGAQARKTPVPSLKKNLKFACCHRVKEHCQFGLQTVTKQSSRLRQLHARKLCRPIARRES
jgi:hypothetical protein